MNLRINASVAVLGLALAAGAVPAVALAQAAAARTQPTAEILRAFTGAWTRVETPRPAGTANTTAEPGAPQSTVNDRRFPPALESKLTPRSKAAWAKFKQLATDVIDKEPPTPDNNCLPFAIPGETVTTAWPQEIYATPSVVAIHMQIDNQMRLIHMNAQHPANLKPSMHGHSIGWWEGDTLVIDTIGYDLRSQFNDGFIHGPNLHSVERYRVTDGGKFLEKTFTYTDPDALTEPYTFTRRLQKTDKPFQEYLNAQNNTLYECPTAEKGSLYKPVE